jgi:AraC-like DNA-binding protein
METGRGHIDYEAIQKIKDFLRLNHPKGIRAIDIAKHIGCSRARAARLLDLLSGDTNENENTNNDFLVFVNDDELPVTYGIFKDIETGIMAL